MPALETANILLSLGGDSGNTVMKYDVTAAEIAVLRSIHGEDAVKEIEPVGTTSRSNRDELARLRLIYGGARDGSNQRIVDGLFPGAAARVFETIAELEMPEEFFKPVQRVSAEPQKVAGPVQVEPAQDGDEKETSDLDPDLAEMTKKEIGVWAKENLGFEVDSTLNKDSLIAQVEGEIAKKKAAEAEEKRAQDELANDGIGDFASTSQSNANVLG